MTQKGTRSSQIKQSVEIGVISVPNEEQNTDDTERDQIFIDWTTVMEYLHQDLTERIIRCFYEVYNQLGYGFLEKVYEHSMMIELAENGLYAESQQPIKV